MIAPVESFETSSSDPLPNSTRLYVEGRIHPEIRVPMREISLSDTKRLDGSMEKMIPFVFMMPPDHGETKISMVM
jgi:phosphomethylpyrimidine synthase